MADKIKILFVTTEFWQGGAQRYLFEIDKALSKDKFLTSILSLRDLNTSQIWDDHYYSKHQEIGTIIFFLKKINSIRVPTIRERIIHLLFHQKLPPERDPLLKFLNSFDAILFIGEYTYPDIERWLNDEINRKCYICIVNSIAQVPQNYALYNKSEAYKFISVFQDQEIEFEFEGFINYKHFYFPFSIDCNEKKALWKPNVHAKKRIGIFTRLTQHKPIDVFIFGLHLLKDKGIDVVLNVYGTGDPVECGFAGTIESLSLKENVVFKGHQENIIETAMNDNLDLIWFHGYHAFPGGFASFDLSSVGIPQVFWNFTPDLIIKDQDVFPMHSNLNEFVDQSYKILQDPQYALSLGLKQFNYLIENINIRHNIRLLESILEQ
jgi:glycosyltransferase involved in cell wall biosynthesis